VNAVPQLSEPSDATRSARLQRTGIEAPSDVRERQSIATRLAAVAVTPLAAAAAMAVIVLLVERVGSVVADSSLTQTTGGEAPGLYGIYRVWSGEPVYQSLSSNPSTMIYNFLFFYVYGGAARLFAGRPELIPTVSHLLTMVIALAVGMMTFHHLWRESVTSRTKSTVAHAGLLASFVLTGVVGPFISWWALTARPDLLASGFELLALFIFVRAGRALRSSTILTLTTVAWLAWSCKQSAIFIYLGILFCLAIRREWKSLVVSSAMYGILCAAVFAIAGRPYLEHTIIASGSLMWTFRQVVAVSREAVVLGAYVWLPAGGIAWLGLRNTERSARDRDLLIVLSCAVAGALLTVGRFGSSRNYLLAPFMVSLVLVGRQMARRPIDAERSGFVPALLCISFALSMGLSASVLTSRNTFGRVQLMIGDERPLASARRDEIRAAPQPVFVQWPYLALPWNSGQHVTDVLDWDIYEQARSRGVIVSIEDRLHHGFYASALVNDPRLIAVLEESPYRRVRTTEAGTLFMRSGVMP
jgi:hypothetical protein